MYGKVQRVCLAYQIVFPFTHFLSHANTSQHRHKPTKFYSGPTKSSSIPITFQIPHQVGHAPTGLLKFKHQLARLVECDTVCLEPFRKTKLPVFLRRHKPERFTLPHLQKGSLDRIDNRLIVSSQRNLIRSITKRIALGSGNSPSVNKSSMAWKRPFTSTLGKPSFCKICK